MRAKNRKGRGQQQERSITGVRLGAPVVIAADHPLARSTIAKQLIELQAAGIVPKRIATDPFVLPADHPLAGLASVEFKAPENHPFMRALRAAQPAEPTKARNLGRRRVAIPHLDLALLDLDRARATDPALRSSPKRAADHVIRFIRSRGGKIEDNQEATLRRRIVEWDKNKIRRRKTK